ncbi:MAG: twin-arginine translocation signal domain-containing protein [Nitrospirota bacterium]|nr:MAG: twin-arginine translocation signal domain-containing protein [Nitrospirota bacterium]
MEDKNIHSTSVQTSRRSFLKASAAAAGTAGVLGVSSVSGLLASTAQPADYSIK